MDRIYFIFIFSLNIVTCYGQFQDVTEEYGINHVCINPALMGGGAVFSDVNMDGWIDLYVTGGDADDKLYINIEGEKFEEKFRSLPRRSPGTLTSGVISGDYNNDGCPDLFITTFDINHPNILLRNNCDGTFDDVSEENNIIDASSSMGAAFVDFNSDGYLDIYVINYVREFHTDTDENGNFLGFSHECYNNYLYKNVDGQFFEEVAQDLRVDSDGCGLAVTTLVDEEGNQGIYIANDFGEWLQSNEYYVFNADSNFFVDVAPENGLDIGLNGMGIAIGDYDLDRDFDLYVTNLGRNYFLQNNGFQFVNIAAELEVENDSTDNQLLSTSWGTIFSDIDNDSDEDLIVANGWVETGSEFQADILDPNKVFLNTEANFEEISKDLGLDLNGINRGVIEGDIDNDGDQDLVFTYVNFIDLGIEDPNKQYKLFKNTTSGNNFLAINLIGIQSSYIPFGSTVEVFTQNNSYLKYLYSGGTHASQNSNILHFGLNQIEEIDSIKVIWSSGNKDVYNFNKINSFIQLTEGKSEVDILGCMQSDASNFNPDATVDFGCSFSGSTAVYAINDLSPITVFPTLVRNNHLYIQSELKADDVEIAIYDLSGTLRFKTELDFSFDTVLPINIQKLNANFYIIKITTDKAEFSTRIVKM